MENKLILLDTSILIDHIRKTNKPQTWFSQLAERYDLAISTVTGFELLIGKTNLNAEFTDGLLQYLDLLPYSKVVMEESINIYTNLKKRSLLLPPLDIFIAATAITHNLLLATFNRQHFERIEHLELLIEN